MVYPATESPNIIGPEGLPMGRVSLERVLIHVRRNWEYVAGEFGWLVEM